MTIKNFRYYIVICIICLLIISLAIIHYLYANQTSLTRSERAELARIGNLVMVGDEGFPPLSFTDNRGQYSGFEADLVKAIENRLSIRIKYTQMNWSEAVKAQKAGKIMGITGMRVTEARAKYLHFTRPYFSTAYSLITMAGESVEALLNQPQLRVAAQKGSATIDYFMKYYHRPGMEYTFVGEPSMALDLLEQRKVDIWVESYQIARFTAMKNDRTKILEFNTIPGSSGDYAIAFGKDYGSLVTIFNKTLISLERDGTLSTLGKKWFGVTSIKDGRTAWFLIIMGFLFIFFTVILLFSILSMTLKKMVDDKTEQHRLLLDNIPIQIWYLQDAHTYGLVNKAHANFIGRDLKAVQGKKIADVVEHQFTPEEISKMIEANQRVVNGNGPMTTEERVRDAEGNWHILKITRTPKLDKRGKITYIVCSGEDITELKLADKALRQSKWKIEQLHEIAIRMERCQFEEGVYHLIIRAAEGILQFKLCSVCVLEGGQRSVKATSSSVSPEMVQEFWGQEESQDVKRFFRHEMPIGEIGVFQVITEEEGALTEEELDLTQLLLLHAVEALKRIRSEEKIRYLSFHDSLTGLYNRAFFDEELKRLDTWRQLPLSLIMGDLNGLKLVNDVFGHHRGDELIVKVGHILRNTCRQEDIVIRWGGDEMAILLPQTDEATAEKICQRIRKACLDAIPEPIQPSIALGTATKTDVTQDVDECLKEAENRMYKNKLAESRAARSEIIASLKKNLGSKSYETEEHTQNLQKLAVKLATALNTEECPLDELLLLAAYHDIGMIAMPESIIQKRTVLNQEEREQIRRHPEIGYRLAQGTPELLPIAEAILSHQEWWNGTGYPQGLQGEDIPLLSRIIAVVDAYDVMTTGRPYKKALSPEEALKELTEQAGEQFDPDIVKAFCELIREADVAESLLSV